MSTFRSDLPAREVDRCLRAAVAELQRVERNAVLWFAEVLRRKLYRDLGYGSIQQYAELALGFGPGKMAQFIRLSEALRELPRLRESLARGEVGWTKARTVAAVATPETETVWLEAAKRESRTRLEARVRRARGRTRAVAKGAGARGQAALALMPEDGANTRVPEAAEPPAAPVEVSLRFTPEQYARYEALLELLRREGARDERVELLLGGLEALAAEKAGKRTAEEIVVKTAVKTGEGSGTSKARRGASGEPGEGRSTAVADTGGTAAVGAGAKSAANPTVAPALRAAAYPPYQVHVQLCPSCAGGAVVTGRGPQALHPRELRAILCDARVQARGKRNRAAIPPKVRRAVLERDGLRCRSAGCGRVRFLAVHHLAPRVAGGSNDPENLITLCGACHRALHAQDPEPGKRGRQESCQNTRVPRSAPEGKDADRVRSVLRIRAGIESSP